MISAPARFARMLMLALLLSLALVQPAVAQDAGILRDTETEALFRDLAKPLIIAAGLDPASTKVVLLGDPEINAFVARGQIVYLQSGLILAADNVGEVQGVVAHELGHVNQGVSIRMAEGDKQTSGITIATLILGALALAMGAGEAGMGIIAAGQQAAMGKFLAFSRTQEASADQAAAIYLSKAGVSGKGMLDFFSKLQNQEYRLAIYAKDSYDRTHPLSNERIEALQVAFKAAPAWGKPADPALEARFQRVKAKLYGFSNAKQAIFKYPESDLSVPGHYARAYAYHVGGYSDKALFETAALLKTAPEDPYFLELKGQVLLESGKPAEAIAPLRAARAASGDAPLISAMLGHALVATEDPKNFAEAKSVLKAAVNRDNQDPFAWYQLGIIYDREGDDARAQLATAERSNLEAKPKLALASAELAMRGIPPSTPDWLRAQDIAMVSRAELKKKKHGKDEDE
ncbi:MAG: M48 family metalloprotease [Pseudomonadota bacterium]